ncbi:MAG: diaminopimelate epimerase [Clostridia bacterium]|nr:diaminopimelate epimerase [Clostridia bacterium]
MTTLKFTKMHGIGNDYIYLNCLAGAPEQPGALAKRLSHRHLSVGSNGLVLILPSTQADFRMRMFNADGSEGSMCGNAIRCIGKYVYTKGLTDKTELAIETASGIKHLKLNITDGVVQTVSVDMSAPVIDSETLTVDANAHTYTGRRISMGNPHFVIFCKDVENMPVRTDGPVIENQTEHFSDRVNVEFAELLSPTEIRMRVWERGSGETMACGTGACASAAAAVYEGFCPENTDISVFLPGGILTVRRTNETLWMTGPAEFVFEGTIEI